MQKVVFVTETNSYLLLSLKEKLEEHSYLVQMVKADVDELDKLKDRISILLIYADEDMMNKQQPLTYIKDKMVEEDIPVFLVGNADELDAVKKIIPKYLIHQEFLRPINVVELAEAMDHDLRRMGSEAKKKILVVDDSGAMLRNAKGWLEGKYQVILANSGAMAIKYLAINRPDLVLLDYEMPVINGKQVLEMIRTETEFTDIPVIFLTSKGDRESVMEVMALKPEGYLLKTMEPAQIVKTVDDFFERQKAINK